MRADPPAWAALKFWALQPRSWGVPAACLAVACSLPRLLGDLPPEAALLPVAVAALAAGFWTTATLTVLDPPRATLTPGWVSSHRRWMLALLVPANAGFALSLSASLLPVAPSVMLATLAASVGVVVGADQPDRLTGVRRANTSTAS